MAKNPYPYIQVDRDFQYDPLFTDPKRVNELKLYLWLRLNASHKQETYKGVTLEKGQLIRSYQQMSEGTGLSKDQARYSLDYLFSHSYIHITRRGTRASIITVFVDADNSLSHSLTEHETLENTGKNDCDNTKVSHSFGHSDEKTQSDTENTKTFPIVFSHSLKDAEPLENAGKTEQQSDELSHSFFPPYENNKINKVNDVKETESEWETGESVENPEAVSEIVNNPTEETVLTAENGVSDAVVTITRRTVSELTRDPDRQYDLLKLLEQNNDEPLTIPKSVLAEILRTGL